ncbi:hypothetical protein MRX96_001807 [Rhipicephalus microplus]
MKQLALLSLFCVVADDFYRGKHGSKLASLDPVWILELPRRPGPRKLPVPPNSATGDREQHFYNGCTATTWTLPVTTSYSGPGAGYFRRYYFDNVTKTCEKFVFGGCHANGNNFVTLDECQNTCWVTPPEVCTYPADSGPCRAYMPRFFYNTETKKCEQFIYGGCGGNANNFLTFDACEKKCLKVFGVMPHA